MKIATYNINGINGRLGNLLRWLGEADPDIVCLQELKCENHKFPEQALKDAHGRSTRSSVTVVLSQKSTIRKVTGNKPQASNYRRISSQKSGNVSKTIMLHGYCDQYKL